MYALDILFTKTEWAPRILLNAVEIFSWLGLFIGE